jgi:hypothetical protein
MVGYPPELKGTLLKMCPTKLNYLLGLAALLLSNLPLAYAECLTPPVGDNLARGCYVESTVWFKGDTSITLWQPAKPWRGDWQQGDEHKDAAVLVFNKAGSSKLINQWCTRTCFVSGGKTLTLPSLVVDAEVVVWLANPTDGNRHADVGDVISVNNTSGAIRTLASHQWLLRLPTFREVWSYNSCQYVMADAVFSASPVKSTVPQGYLMLSHPQPIALSPACNNMMVTEANQPKQLKLLKRLLGEKRMTQSSRHLQPNDWSVIDGKLHWQSKKNQWEELN